MTNNDQRDSQGQFKSSSNRSGSKKSGSQSGSSSKSGRSDKR